ncbi:shufflon system plasmid conjugative transfer pilus tip adhesin PilV [Acetobacter sp. TBRC 12305]|uniref:Shufflon system plasmid conjugative transfer pilus tip adhesin PilV n=1 Tax=Acetobacter garciniae TaxID=2817435 RepID=A0A939HQI7_9PROT|nr:shufflon system plasmid conjugative transfer pilus tip adhesin PilV [Acetobacter garciniae]MBO1326268.1 shufflon system plasmid conjugative transfer pilus tip adhesin PilV [Acetobacter garciniae]MBX0345994.1 shufflon system plasmid conjugative transfer pilus tip adhesin PilV [Acetobacter garciniae]
MGEILAALVAMFAGLSIIPHYNALVANNTQETIDANAATQFQTMITGANKYVSANLQSLTASVPVGGATTEVPFATIATAGDVPTGFSATNVLGQAWHVYVRQPVSGEIQALVEGEGGQQLEPADMVKIAGLTGALGGYVPYNGMLGNLSSTEAVGTNWSLPLSGLPSPGAGRLVGNLVFGGADSTAIDTNSFLYRVGVPGHGELNTMNVALNMGDNDINSVGTLNATTVNAPTVNASTVNASAVNASQGNFSSTVYAAGQIGTGGYHPGQAIPGGWSGLSTMDMIAHGTIAAGTDNNGVYNVQVGSYGNGVHHGDIWASEAVSANVFRPSFVATAGNACNGVTIYGSGGNHNAMVTYTGDQARDTDGNPLSCVDGTWKASTGGGDISFYEILIPTSVPSDASVLISNPYTGGGSCPSGTVDRVVSYEYDSGSDATMGNDNLGYFLHACTAN